MSASADNLLNLGGKFIAELAANPLPIRFQTLNKKQQTTSGEENSGFFTHIIAEFISLPYTPQPNVEEYPSLH